MIWSRIVRGISRSICRSCVDGISKRCYRSRNYQYGASCHPINHDSHTPYFSFKARSLFKPFNPLVARKYLCIMLISHQHYGHCPSNTYHASRLQQSGMPLYTLFTNFQIVLIKKSGTPMFIKASITFGDQSNECNTSPFFSCFLAIFAHF